MQRTRLLLPAAAWQESRAPPAFKHSAGLARGSSTRFERKHTPMATCSIALRIYGLCSVTQWAASRLDGMRHGAAVVRGAQHTPGRQLLGCGAGVHLSRQFQLKTCSSFAPALCATPVRGTGVQRGARQPQLRQRKLWRLDPKASGRAGSNLGWDCRPASFDDGSDTGIVVGISLHYPSRVGACGANEQDEAHP